MSDQIVVSAFISQTENVDGDDWVDKFYLDTLFKLAEANNSDLVVTGHFREFDGKIETIK